MILTTWSFGNNRKAYIYWKEIENRKYLTHKIIFSKTEKEYKSLIKRYNETKAWHFEKYWAVWDCFLPDDDWETFNNLDKLNLFSFTKENKEFQVSENKRYYKFWSKCNYIRKFYKWFKTNL